MTTRANLRTLIVEDREVMLKIIRRLMVQLGFEQLDQAADGMLALEKVKAARYDLILSDWNMDGMSGFELLKLVRQDAINADVPFILVTAESKPENIQAAKAAGASAYLLKPFKLDALEETIDHVLAAKGFVAGRPSAATVAT